MWERYCVWLWHAGNRAILKAVTFAVCLASLPALPDTCNAQQKFLNPLYTQQDLTTDRLLQGVWEDADFLFGVRLSWRIIPKFQPGKTGCYDLNLIGVVPAPTDLDLQEAAVAVPMNFNACLVKLGQMVFLDLQPEAVPVPATTETFHLAQPTGPNHKNPFSPSVLQIEGRLGDQDLSGLFVTLVPVLGQDSPGAQSEYELRITPAHWISRIWISERTLRLSDFDPDGDVAMLSTRELQKLVLKDAEESKEFKNAEEFKHKDGGSR